MRSNRVTRHAVILAAALALSACGDDPAPVEDGSVSGEVLEGSISDDMLPLDTIQSRSPPMEAQRSDSSTTDEVGSEESDAPESPGEEEPAPEAEEPAPEE